MDALRVLCFLQHCARKTPYYCADAMLWETRLLFNCGAPMFNVRYVFMDVFRLAVSLCESFSWGDRTVAAVGDIFAARSFFGEFGGY